MPTHPATITAAAERLRQGGLVAFPTETVYGLGADALNPLAIEGVFRIKGRPANNPLIVHVSDESMARGLASTWPDAAAALAERFWPGPLSIVLPRLALVPSNVTAGGPNVALRCPDHPTAIALIETLGRPIVGPSANPSGGVSPTTAQHVRESFSPDDVLVLDGGPCRAGIESTVLSLAGPTPRLLRQGVITPDMIRSVIGQDVGTSAGTTESGGAASPMASPGMLRSHYAPHAPAVLFAAAEWPVILQRSDAVVVITHVQSRDARPPNRVIRMPNEATAYAASLYAAMRDADAVRPGLIAIERPDAKGGVWDAIRDRLARATAIDTEE